VSAPALKLSAETHVLKQHYAHAYQHGKFSRFSTKFQGQHYAHARISTYNMLYGHLPYNGNITRTRVSALAVEHHKIARENLKTSSRFNPLKEPAFFGKVSKNRFLFFCECQFVF
jgi:hypothetical protein